MRYCLLAVVLLGLAASSAAEPLQEYLADKIIADYRLDPNYVSVALVRSSLSADDVSASEVKIYPLTQADPVGHFPMRVEIYRGGELTERGTVTLNVRRYADLFVPKQNIRRHELLTSDLFERKRFEVTSLTEKMLTEATQIVGCRAGQNLTAGRYVSLSRVEKTPDVDNGFPVTIIGKGQMFEIRAKGLALQDGAIGETIRVKNIDSRKILTGTITAPGVVEVEI